MRQKQDIGTESARYVKVLASTKNSVHKYNFNN